MLIKRTLLVVTTKTMKQKTNRAMMMMMMIVKKKKRKKEMTKRQRRTKIAVALRLAAVVAPLVAVVVAAVISALCAAFAALFAAGAELGVVDGLAPDRRRRCSQCCFLVALFVDPVAAVLGAPLGQLTGDGSSCNTLRRPVGLLCWASSCGGSFFCSEISSGSSWAFGS